MTSEIRRRSVLLTALLLLSAATLFARTHPRKTARPVANHGRPIVEDVSPPNWWSNLPNPMLLLHGKNLNDAEVTSSVAGISVRRSKASADGHWEFVWLDISSAPPQHFNLLVRNARGRTHYPYELDKRHPPTDGFQGFSSSDVLYLAMPDRFADGDVSNDRLKSMPGTFDRSNPSAYHGGDLAGMESHLDYLQQLGVTALWITPLYAQDPASATDYSGYRPFDFYRMNPHFGTVADYENLAQAVHARGMKLVLDMVMNHVSPASPWAKDPPAPDWFHGTPEKHLKATNNFATIADPHASAANYSAPVDGWLTDTLPDLNQSNPLVQHYLIQNAIWWIETGTLDGLRLDTYANVDRSFWQQFHTVLHALYPHLTAAGEIFSSDPTVVSYFAGGVKHSGIDTGLYTPFDYPGYFALRATLTGASPAPMTSLTDIERQDWLYPHPERLATFFGNQDTPRFLSQPGATPDRLKIAFGLLATQRGMPQIYYGDEIGLSAASDGDSRGDFPGGFPGDAQDAFTEAGRTPAQQAMVAWVAGLLQLRAHNVVLQTGLQQNLLADQSGFVFARYAAPSQTESSTPGAAMLVLTNRSDATRTFHLDFSRTVLEGATTLAPAWNSKNPVTVEKNQCDVPVPPESVAVYSVQP